ncbi:MAG TPA: helix-turn-helix domain-containing protein [Candidatus Sulfotelmatobacter sp.]|nr:helix-turn-helix domain-containing protein [Candidatus Sulfotelmatobacter sp.]
MSLERVMRILEEFGLSEQDAEIYVYLAKKGPKQKGDLSLALKLTNRELELSLKNLQSKGIVAIILDQFALFSALAFEKVLDMAIKVNIERASAVKETKEELLSDWQSNIKEAVT